MTKDPRNDALKVLNVSRNVPGPVAGLMLADVGADVIKVENPRTGDGNRDFRPFIHGQGVFHWALNAGSRSVALDPHDSNWPEAVARLMAWADIVIAGGGERRTRRLGLDFESAVRHNRQIVYVSLTGYGEVGRMRDFPAHGLNPDAFAGIVPVEWADGVPSPPAGYQAVGATLAGVFGALGALAGVRRRDQTGEAQYVHASLLGSAFWWNWRNVVSIANLDEAWWDYSNIGSRYATYRTADGRAILIAPMERKFWLVACDALGLPDQWRNRGDWDAGGGYDRGPGYADERAFIAGVIAQHSLAHWCATFEAVGIPFAPLLTGDEVVRSALDDPQSGLLRNVEMPRGSAWIPAAPVRVTASPAQAATAPAPVVASELGSDTNDVLSMLGISNGLPSHERHDGEGP